MKGWKSNENMDFNFYDAHDIRPLTTEPPRKRLGRRSDRDLRTQSKRLFSSAKIQRIFTDSFAGRLKSPRRTSLPIIVVKPQWWPTDGFGPLSSHSSQLARAHVAFKAKIIQHALDKFPDEYYRIQASAFGPALLH